MAEIKLKIASVVIGSGEGGGSGVTPYYTDLPDKPSINGETLVGEMTSEDLGLASSEQSVPAGGTTGQVLAKKSNADNDVQWVNQESGGQGTTDYADLGNKPKINNVTLSGNKTAAQLGLQAELVSGTNIKTINNQSIVGTGNISIESGGTEVEANPTYVGTPETLNTIKIGSSVYTAPQGPQGETGPAGATGPQGETGATGKSAYQIYVDGGGTLTEEQWLASLKANIGEFLFVPTDAAAVTAMGTIGQTYTSAIDPQGKNVAPTQDTLSVILLMNAGTTPDKTMMIATQESATPDTYEFIYAGDLQSAMPSNVLTDGRIVNDLTTGGTTDVASAETVKTIAETTMELVESLNILDPSTIIVGEYIKADTINNTISKEPIPSGSTYFYGHTDFISLPNEGLRCNGVSSVSGSRRSTFLFSSNNIESFICWLNGSVFNPSDYPTAKYVIYNLAPVPDGYTPETYYAVYKGQTIPEGNPIPYTPPQLSQKPQSFESGEKINEVQIDNTNLASPNNNSLAKAVDVKNSVDEINTKLSGIDYSESNVELVTSGEGQNVYSGVVAVGRWRDLNYGPYLLIPVDGVKKIKFLAGEKSTNSSDVGFAIGTFSGEPNATLEGFSSVYYRGYALSSTTRQVEYEYVIPQGYTGLYAAISIWKSAGVTTSNFYCKTISGDTLDDVIQEKIDNSETSVKPSTSTGSVGNVNIHCAKEHTFNDGTPPILEWFLVEEPMGKFYYTKDFNTKTLLFTFADSRYYQFGILKNGDIIAVRLADSLDDSTPQSDSKRTNPYVWKADENWSVQHEVVFGDYDASNASDASDIANITGLKPCGWLANKGFRVLPDGSAMFGEYTRPTVETCNVWRIDGDALEAENWHVVKTFYPIGGDGFTGYKHVHHIGVDHYTGTVYCATGDVDAYAQIWYTLDYGDTWTQISKNSALNNGQQFRLCFMTFTKDYVLWATDTPGTSTGGAKHVVYRGERDEDGILDSSTLEMICNVYDDVGNISSYGQAYLQEYDALFLFDRQDGGGVQSDFLPLYVVDVSTGVKHKVADLTGYTQRIGFRTKFKEWYPINGIIRVGFGYSTDYCNNNKICGNQQFVTTNDRGKTTVNNLCLIVKKDGDNWTCRFSTYYV